MHQKTYFPACVQCQLTCSSLCSEPAQLSVNSLSSSTGGGSVARGNTDLTIFKQQAKKFQEPETVKRPAPSCGTIINSTSQPVSLSALVIL